MLLRGFARSRRSNRRSGFSVVEVAVTLLLLTIILGAAAIVGSSGSKIARASELQTQVQARSRRAVDQMFNELINAGLGQLNPDPGPIGTTAFNWRKNTGIDLAGTPTWSEVWRLELQADPNDANDGLDNDSDGLIDERTLVMTSAFGALNARPMVLSRQVSELAAGELANGADDNGNGLVDEPGFIVTRVDDLVTIRLTLEAHASAEGTNVQAAVETSVTLRN
jgi:type II secretory pathway pseudopilin PulG